MSENTEAQRRVRRPSDKEPLIQLLIAEHSPFDTYRDLMVFAAVIGYSRGERKPFRNSGEPILWQYFQTAGYEPIINMMAASEAGNPDILSPEQHGKRLEIFEEFANGGLEVLDSEIRRRAAESPLNVVLDLILGQLSAPSTDGTSVSALVKEFGA